MCVPPCGSQGTPQIVWLPGQVPFSDEPSHGPKKKILKSKAQFFKKVYYPAGVHAYCAYTDL